MTLADLPAVTALEDALFPEDAWSREMFASELASGPAGRYYLVAEDAGGLVGYAGLLAPPRDADGAGDAGGAHGAGAGAGGGGEADVLTMAVAEAHWGRGIGTALLTALVSEAAERGCAEVFLEVRADNPRAQRLYRKHGFGAVGLRRGYYQPSGTDAIVMRRPVGAAPVDQARVDQARVDQARVDQALPASTTPASGGTRS
jgi:ribosomal-protein-alanine N-acetyltransferase